MVEENKSIFPFADRIELVCKGTADLPNVVVLPSGKFIILSLTFIGYFGKSELQDQIIAHSMDIEIFGQYIAPTPGITVRFVGKNPLIMLCVNIMMPWLGYFSGMAWHSK